MSLSVARNAENFDVFHIYPANKVFCKPADMVTLKTILAPTPIASTTLPNNLGCERLNRVWSFRMAAFPILVIGTSF